MNLRIGKMIWTTSPNGLRIEPAEVRSIDNKSGYCVVFCYRWMQEWTRPMEDVWNVEADAVGELVYRLELRARELRAQLSHGANCPNGTQSPPSP
jgi:hypothetical protein